MDSSYINNIKYLLTKAIHKCQASGKQSHIHTLIHILMHIFTHAHSFAQIKAKAFTNSSRLTNLRLLHFWRGLSRPLTLWLRLWLSFKLRLLAGVLYTKHTFRKAFEHICAILQTGQAAATTYCSSAFGKSPAAAAAGRGRTRTARVANVVIVVTAAAGAAGKGATKETRRSGSGRRTLTNATKLLTIRT